MWVVMDRNPWHLFQVFGRDGVCILSIVAVRKKLPSLKSVLNTFEHSEDVQHTLSRRLYSRPFTTPSNAFLDTGAIAAMSH